MLLGEECVKNADAGENQFSCAYLILFIFKNHLNVFEIVCVHACVFSCVSSMQLKEIPYRILLSLKTIQ